MCPNKTARHLIMDNEMNMFGEPENKAGYNQSMRITELLAYLRNAYVVAMNEDNFEAALKAIRRIHDIISPKLKDETPDINNKTYELEDLIPTATRTHINNGHVFYSNIKLKKEMEKKLEELYRFVEKLQDQYGYGMLKADDPRLAVLQR